MDKEKSPSPSLPPQPPLPSSSSSSGRHSPLPSPQPPSGGGRFSHDLSRMPDFPPRSAGHRRAHSEILALPDDITFDSDLGVVGGGAGGTAEGSDEADDEDIFSYLNIDKFAGSSSFSAAQMGGDGVFEESGAGVDVGAQHYAASSGMGGSWAGPSVERPRIRHQHSMSMDGSTSIKSELLTSGGEGASSAEAKKAMSAAKLAELAAVDPKRAKRIWANRQSAARSKERKMRYIAELERKVQTLQTEATTLSAQLTMLQRDTTGLNAENSELKLRVQSMEQQVHIQDALNDALREEVQRLKLVTGQVIPNGGQMMGYGSGSFGTAASQPFYPQNHAMQSILAAQQFQQLHIHSQQLQSNQLQHQHQQQLPPSMELKSRAPVTISSPNQNHRDSSSDPNNLLPKD